MKNILTLIEELERQGKRKIYAPKQAFVNEGEIPHKIGIIKKGLFRYYYLTKEGKEFTKVFMKEGDIISSYTSIIPAFTIHHINVHIPVTQASHVTGYPFQRPQNTA